MNRLAVGDFIDVKAEGDPQWYLGIVTYLDGGAGFFLECPALAVHSVWRAWNTEGIYWRRRKARPVSPCDGRCERDPTYHDRLRSDAALFDAEGIAIGRQEVPGLVMELALCPGCGTTVSKTVEDSSE